MYFWGSERVVLKALGGLAGEDCQHAVTDESLCPVTGCTLGIDVCHWMFKTKGQEDGPLRTGSTVAFIPDDAYDFTIYHLVLELPLAVLSPRDRIHHFLMPVYAPNSQLNFFCLFVCYFAHQVTINAEKTEAA